MIADECVGEDSLSIRFHAFSFSSIYNFAPYIMISSTTNHVSRNNRLYHQIRIYLVTRHGRSDRFFLGLGLLGLENSYPIGI